MHKALQFCSEFMIQMRAAVPLEEDHKCYLIQAMKKKLDQHNWDEKILEEILDFMMCNVLGQDWESDLDSEMDRVRQCDSEKIKKFAERLNLYLDVLGIEHDSK